MTTLDVEESFWESFRGQKKKNAMNESRDMKNVPQNGAEREKRGKVLLQAHQIINGERQEQYGNPESTFCDIAHLWSWWLRDKLAYELTPEDAAMMMTLMKIARERGGAGKMDNIVDACGYLGLYEDMRGRVKK